MTSPVSRDAWKTPEIRAAEAKLEAAVERGRQTVQQADELMSRLRPTGVSDEEVQQLERAARARDASPELRALAEKVDRGDLTWRQIADGDAMDDPAVKAVAAVNLGRMGEVYQQFEEGMTLEQVLEAQGLSADDAGDSGRRSGDDDDGGGGSVLRRSW